LDFLYSEIWLPRKTVSGITGAKLNQSANGVLKYRTVNNMCLNSKHPGKWEKEFFETGKKDKNDREHWGRVSGCHTNFRFSKKIFIHMINGIPSGVCYVC
jgi:hypothetical protein